MLMKSSSGKQPAMQKMNMELEPEALVISNRKSGAPARRFSPLENPTRRAGGTADVRAEEAAVPTRGTHAPAGGAPRRQPGRRPGGPASRIRAARRGDRAKPVATCTRRGGPYIGRSSA